MIFSVLTVFPDFVRTVFEHGVLRRACDSVPERIALVGTGGISHWPATPDSGKVNEAWDREFMRRWCGTRWSTVAPGS